MNKQELIQRGYSFKERVYGKLLWTDGRDGQAVLMDSEGNEYYADSSSSPLFDFMDNKSKYVSFEIATIPNYGPMAWNAKQGLE